MAVVDAHVRVHHPCPYCDISVEFPRTLLLLWCDNRRDVFLVAAPDAVELRRVMTRVHDSFRARRLVMDGSDALVTVLDFEWEQPPSVASLARRFGVWVLPPVVYFEGKETYRFVAPRRLELNRLIERVRQFGDVEILSVSNRGSLASVRDLPVATVHFYEGLTDRQARALVAAYDGGLLDVPARGSWNDVARREGLSRSTFGEHLRKGQLRLVANSQTSLKARLGATSERVLLPAKGSARRPRRT